MSTYCLRKEQKFEEKKVYRTLEQNGYPRMFISSRIPTSHDSGEKKFTPNCIACIPYVQGNSEAISRVLMDLKVKVCFKPVNTYRRVLSQPKDVVAVWSKSNVVYKVKCKECEASYAGESVRRLETRITEHKRALQKGETNVLALTDHAWRVGHHIDWDSPTILGVSSGYYSRLALEAIHIKDQEDN